MEKTSSLNYIHSTTFTIVFSELVPTSSVEGYILTLTLSLYLTSLCSFLQIALFMRISDLGFKHIYYFFNYADTTDTLFNPI